MVGERCEGGNVDLLLGWRHFRTEFRERVRFSFFFKLRVASRRHKAWMHACMGGRVILVAASYLTKKNASCPRPRPSWTLVSPVLSPLHFTFFVLFFSFLFFAVRFWYIWFCS